MSGDDDLENPNSSAEMKNNDGSFSKKKIAGGLAATAATIITGGVVGNKGNNAQVIRGNDNPGTSAATFNTTRTAYNDSNNATDYNSPAEQPPTVPFLNYTDSNYTNYNSTNDSGVKWVNSTAPTSTNNPSNSPSDAPSNSPTDAPSNSPTDAPSLSPSKQPSLAPSKQPSQSNKNTQTPSRAPVQVPDGLQGFDIDGVYRNGTTGEIIFAVHFKHGCSGLMSIPKNGRAEIELSEQCAGNCFADKKANNVHHHVAPPNARPTPYPVARPKSTKAPTPEPTDTNAPTRYPTSFPTTPTAFPTRFPTDARTAPPTCPPYILENTKPAKRESNLVFSKSTEDNMHASDFTFIPDDANNLNSWGKIAFTDPLSVPFKIKGENGCTGRMVLSKENGYKPEMAWKECTPCKPRKKPNDDDDNTNEKPTKKHTNAPVPPPSNSPIQATRKPVHHKPPTTDRNPPTRKSTKAPTHTVHNEHCGCPHKTATPTPATTTKHTKGRPPGG